MLNLRTASLLVSSVSLMASATVMAQETAPQDNQNENDDRIIIVSIKNPGTEILGYAGSANTVDADELDARHVQDLSSLSYAAPNVSLDPIGTFKGVANFSIRGLGINSSIPSIDPAVGLFIDGVYMGVNAGTVFDLLDVESVDILRGPQGVAFGRNTTGGAVLIRTADPSFDWLAHTSLAFEGPVDKGRGGPMTTARAAISGPLQDNVAIRLGVLHSSDDGYFRNGFTGQDFGASETTVVRGGLTIKSSDRLTFTLKGEWTQSSGDGATTHNNGQFARDSFNLSVDEEGFYESENTFAVLRADYELDIGVITNITGWREYELFTRNDIDSSPVTIFESDTGTTQEQWSNELFYAADYGKLALTLGGYIFHQEIAYDESRDLSGIGFGFQYGGGRQDHDVYGLYGQLDYDLTSALNVSAGLRWSREEKDAAITYVSPRDDCSAIAGTCPVGGIRPSSTENNGFTDSQSWSNLSPRIALTYRASETASLYTSWTRGFRSGGYNLRITQPDAFEEVSSDLDSPAFNAERVDSFEAGVKWRSGDGRARISAAAFLTEVDNLQREINVPSESSGLAQSVYNTADARIKGVEIEAEFSLTSSLQLSANIGYIDAQYKNAVFDIDSSGAIDSDDLALALPRAPEWTWGGGLTYSAPLAGKASLLANVWFQHRSSYAYTDNNWGYNGPSDRLDASIAVNLGDPNITLSLFGRNLLDEVQFGSDTQLPFAGGAFSDGNSEPFDPNPNAGTFSPVFKGRVIGVEVSMDF